MCLVLSFRNQFVSEYLSESPVVSFRLPYRRRNVRLASRALVRLMVAAAPAKDKARVAKEAAENPEQLLQFATSNVYQLKYVHAQAPFSGAAGMTQLSKPPLILFFFFRVCVC